MRNLIHYKKFITFFVSLQMRMKKLSYILSYIKQDVYTFLSLFLSSIFLSFFFFLVPSLFETHDQLTHPPVKCSTIPLRKMTVSQGVSRQYTNFTPSWVVPLRNSATAHSTFGKALNSSSHKDARFSGRCTLAYEFRIQNPRQKIKQKKKNFILSCVIPLWNSATAHSLSSKELISSIVFLRVYCCVMFSYYPAWAFCGLVLTHIFH